MANKFLKIAVLISNKGTGSNLYAVLKAIILRHLNAETKIVISDNPDALGLIIAQKYKIPSSVFILKNKKSQRSRSIYSKKLATYLNDLEINIAILAGFSTILSKSFLQTFKGITVNIHPGLIPDEEDKPHLFPDGTEAPWNKGMIAKKAVENFLTYSYSGSTIHVVTENPDFGPVLERVYEKVLPNDTVESLYRRLKKKEHKGLISVLKKIENNEE